MSQIQILRQALMKEDMKIIILALIKPNLMATNHKQEWMKKLRKRPISWDQFRFQLIKKNQSLYLNDLSRVLMNLDNSCNQKFNPDLMKDLVQEHHVTQTFIHHLHKLGILILWITFQPPRMIESLQQNSLLIKDLPPLAINLDLTTTPTIISLIIRLQPSKLRKVFPQQPDQVSPNLFLNKNTSHCLNSMDP